MAISFPSSKSTGQKFTHGNKAWTWDGNSWKGGVTAGSDAGTLDSLNSTQFLRSDADDGTTGKLGIGNTNPNKPLTITSDSGANTLGLRARSADDYSFIQFFNNTGTALRGQIYSKAAGDIGFTTGTDSSAGYDLYIKNGTGVGIGTDNPQAKLNISGSSENIRLDNTGTGNYGLEIWRGGNKGASFAWGEGNANLEIKNYRNDSQADGPYANIDFFTGGTNANSGGSPAYSPDLRMRIQQTGEVGIGTSNPRSKLEVNGDGLIFRLDGSPNTSRSMFFRNTSTSNHAQIGADGTLKLWTDDPNTSILLAPENNSNYTIEHNANGFAPAEDNQIDLGRYDKGWKNVYTNDLQLSNMNSEEGNEVDGTNGKWTIQEGEEELFIINRLSGKKYAFMLREIE